MDDTFLPLDLAPVPIASDSYPPEAYLPDGEPAPPFGYGEGPDWRQISAPLSRCACGADGVVFSPGTIAFPATEENDLFLACVPTPAVEAVATRAWCLECAVAAGWPWISAEPPE